MQDYREPGERYSKKNLKIVVDLLFIVPGRNRGTQTYVDNLLPKLNSLPTANVVCLTNRFNHAYYKDELMLSCQLTPVSGGNRLLRLMYQQFIVPHIAKLLGADVLFCPGNLSPVFSIVPTVITVHDTNFRDLSVMHLGTRLVYNALLPRMVRSASKIITCSQFSKGRIVSHLKGVADKINIVYLGPIPTDAMVTDDDWSAIKRKYGIIGDVFLSISSGRPHKNIYRLVQGFMGMKKILPGNHQLVLVGHELDDETRTFLERNAFSDFVIATGYVSESEKFLFLKNSLAYFFPSLYEGFGLPVLEAQSFGLPLAASEYGSLPEVCGQGASYFDAMSVNSITNAFVDLCKDTELRERLIRKGYENLSRFSWRSTATETLEVLGSVAQQ